MFWSQYFTCKVGVIILPPLILSEFPETQLRFKARKSAWEKNLEISKHGEYDNGYQANDQWRAEGSYEGAAESTRGSGSGCHTMRAKKHLSGKTVCQSSRANCLFRLPGEKGKGTALWNVSVCTSDNQCIFKILRLSDFRAMLRNFSYGARCHRPDASAAGNQSDTLIGLYVCVWYRLMKSADSSYC